MGRDPHLDSLYIGPDHATVAGRTGRNVTIAVIDSGVAPGHPHVGAITDGIGILPDGSYEDEYRDTIGHGTAVTAAIREKAPAARLLAVRVFARRLEASIGQLVAAIDWAVQQGADIVNLSLGTKNPEHRTLLAESSSRAAEQGALVISAYESAGTRWLPGSLPEAIPVLLDDSCPREGMRVVTHDDRIMFAASGRPRPIPGVPVEHNLQGISFAVANVAGLLGRLIEDRPPPRSPSGVVKWLTPAVPRRGGRSRA